MRYLTSIIIKDEFHSDLDFAALNFGRKKKDMTSLYIQNGIHDSFTGCATVKRLVAPLCPSVPFNRSLVKASRPIGPLKGHFLDYRHSRHHHHHLLVAFYIILGAVFQPCQNLIYF